MARTTATDVKVIFDTDLTDVVVEAFIDDANLVVTEILGTDTTLSAAQKESIEKWLTAHFLALTRDQKPTEEAAQDARIKYQGRTGMSLDASFYGQQVKILDTTGKMAAKVGKKGVKFKAITSFE